MEITSGNQQSCVEVSFLERARWKSAQLAASALCTSALRITLLFVETYSMDRERSPRRSQWRLPTPTPPQSWQGGRPAYPAVQPQNLPWQPNPRLAQMLSAPVAPQITGAPPPPRTNAQAGGPVHQSAGSGYIRPASPQGMPSGPGMRSFGPLLPADFVQNPNFLDTRTVAGVSLPRWVRRTDWTTKKQIDQCPTHVIPLHSVLYQGWNSYWIRHIAEGKPTFFAGFRSMAETVFCHALFSKLREESIDLDELGMMLSGGRAHQGSPITNDVKLQASQELAGKVVEFMLGLYPQDAPDPKVVDLESQVHMLQQQLARFEKSPALSTAREPTTAASATPSPVPAIAGLSSLPINADSPPPPPRDDISSSKAPDGSTRLVKPDTRSSLFQAFEKGKAQEHANAKVVEPEESTDPASSSGVPAKAEYGTASHVASVVNFPDDSKKSFMTRQWKTCRNDREVTTWIESITLSKANRKKLVTWSAHVQKWHDDLPASEQASLDQTVANWGVPIRDVAKLKAGSLLRILAVATILIA